MCIPRPNEKKPGILPNKYALIGLAIAAVEVLVLSYLR